jgi:hypothetical protein
MNTARNRRGARSSSRTDGDVRLWRNARADIFFYDAAAETAVPCEVKIDADSVVISYRDETGWINYSGPNSGSGHFELRADRVDGRSSMHMFPGSAFLEGFWIEEGQRGMWRISLQP